MTNRSRRRASDTIDEYSQCISSDGVTVRTKCYRVTVGNRTRFEILLDAAGQQAMVDLSIDRAGRLPAIVRQSAMGFAASIAVRLDAGRL